jgi:hypothetical protein
MGILCTCKQPIIDSKERTVIEIDPKMQKPKKEFTNKSTTLKSKIFTKDTTLINHSNDNSPDKDEIYNKIFKNKSSDLDSSPNTKTKNIKADNIKKIKLMLNPKLLFMLQFKRKQKKEK